MTKHNTVKSFMEFISGFLKCSLRTTLVFCILLSIGKRAVSTGDEDYKLTYKEHENQSINITSMVSVNNLKTTPFRFSGDP